MKAINEYIKEHKITVNKSYVYEDKYSASHKPRSSNIDDEKPFTRKGLNDLLADAKLKKFDSIAVYSHDRLTRNVHESLILKFFFNKLKIDVIYCKPGEKLDTESEKLNIFFENLLNNLSALESNMIGSRTRLGNEYNINHGYWAGGPPPYGYKLLKINSRIEKSILSISYTEARIVQDIFNKYLQGLSPKGIADYIKNKYKNNTDRKWTKNSIISIIKNEDYTGVMKWDKKGGARNPIKHENPITSSQNDNNIIIEKEIWEQSRKIRNIQRKQPKFFSTSFLLKGYLVCGKCGKIMRTKNNGGKKGRVYYCLKEKWEWETCIKAELIEPKIIKKLGEYLTFVFSNGENFDDFYEKYKTEFNSKRVMNEKASAELLLQIIKNNDYLLKCENEIDNLQKSLNSSKTDIYETNSDFIISLEELHSYLKINENILTRNKNEVDEKIKDVITTKETLKEFLSQKKNLLDTIKSSTEDKEMYKRSLKLLLYDLVDKVIYNEDKSIDIIIK